MSFLPSSIISAADSKATFSKSLGHIENNSRDAISKMYSVWLGISKKRNSGHNYYNMLYPPSMTNSVPVTYALASESKKTIALAISSGEAKRYIGQLVLAVSCSISSVTFDVRIIGVSVVPGKTQFTLIFLPARSIAMLRAMPTRALLDAE